MVGEQRKEGKETLMNQELPETNPVLCAQNLLSESGIAKVPVSEEALAEYLGYRIETFSADGYPNKDAIHKELTTACAYVDKEERYIRVYEDISESRKRWSIFHEIGHIILPLHSETLYRCFPEDLHDWCKKEIEKEANQCAGELIMPRDIFIPDIAQSPFTVDSIKNLKNKYKTSLEAAAIRYAKLHSGRCAMLMTALKDGVFSNQVFCGIKKIQTLYPSRNRNSFREHSGRCL